MLKPYHSCVEEAGTDEAGRGCLAGPVTAAAVILPETFKNKWLTDSKKVPEPRRRELAAQIRDQALAYAITHVPPETIDQIGFILTGIFPINA